jgi:hypothetical protein
MSFSSMLSIQDRRKLRDIVRRVHLRFYPVDKLSNHECDKFIDSLSAEMIESNLRAGSKLGMD